MIITIYSKANPVWPAAGPLLSGVWSVLNGLFLGAVILISNKIAGNNRINAKAAGIMMEKGKNNLSFNFNSNAGFWKFILCRLFL